MEDKLYWLALNMVPGIGPIAYRNLVAVFRDPERVFAASSKALEASSKTWPWRPVTIKTIRRKNATLIEIKDKSLKETTTQLDKLVSTLNPLPRASAHHSASLSVK